MENYDSKEAAASRADQADPLIMYLVVRESLNMGAGKVGAQCAHASQMLLLNYFKNLDRLKQLNAESYGPPYPRADWSFLFERWLAGSFRKVVLKADDKEWEKVKAEFPSLHVLVIDAGLTEIAAGSETVIGIMPMYKSNQPKILKKLQVLK
jgi:peptidyl-tRNA hydrolase